MGFHRGLGSGSDQGPETLVFVCVLLMFLFVGVMAAWFLGVLVTV